MKKLKTEETIRKYINERKGMGPLSTLTMIFVVLKLTDNIDWSWIYVLSPIWIPIACLGMLFIFVFPVVMMFMLGAEILKRITKRLKK